MAVILHSNPSAPPPEAPIKAPSLWRMILVILQFMQTIIVGLIRGPARPNRTRGLELIIRAGRKFFTGTGLNVQESRYLFKMAMGSGGRGSDQHPSLQNCTIEVLCFDAVLVNKDTAATPSTTTQVKTSLYDRYPSRVNLYSVMKVHGEWIVPDDLTTSDRDRVILYTHGGGFIFGSAAGHRTSVAPLAKKFKRRVFSLDYHLSPESPFPGALHEAVAAYSYLVNQHSILPKNIILMGDSAGGNLAMTTLLFLRDHGYPLPGGAVLISPHTDHFPDLPSVSENLEFDLLMVGDGNPDVNLGHLYVNDDRVVDEMVTTEYLISPALAKSLTPPRPLPPIYISSGRDEVLFDDNVLHACNLIHHQIAPTVIHDIFEHQVHVFQSIVPNSPDSIMYLNRVDSFLHQIVDAKENAESVQGIEVTLINDGIIKHQGLEHTYTPRWKGIQKVKKLDWDLTEVANQHCIIMSPS